MNKMHGYRNKTTALAVAVLLAGCAGIGGGGGWNILPAGSSWQVEQRNTGSYGRDVSFEIVRGDAVWQGQPVVTLTNTASGGSVMATPEGKWVAIVARDGRVMTTFDPPIGYIFPLTAGQAWSTKHKITGPTGTVSDYTYSCKVEGREQVTVPAGSFDTMKIVCDSPVQHEVSWFIPDLGMHAKQEHERFAGHPQGPGTQRAQLLSVQRRS